MAKIIPEWKDYMDLTIDDDHLGFYILKNTKQDDLINEIKLLSNFKYSDRIFNQIDNKFELSPLGVCIMNKLFPQARIMIENGGNISFTNKNGDSLYHLAAIEGADKDILDFLRKEKLSPNITNNQVTNYSTEGKYTSTPCFHL